VATGPLDAPIGEAWFTSDASRIDGGPTLGAAIAADPAGLLGREAHVGHCPLLLKFLFTSERLSVQVHPDDEYAREHHASPGKTEAWHVLDARTDATLGLGFVRDLARHEAVDAARSGAIEHLLHWRPARPGDTWLVPARTVHAIGAGVTIVEVQEMSDVTYRLFDYGRPRELHLERGFDVADLGPYTVENARVALGAGRERLTTCSYFTMERWTLDGRVAFSPGAAQFHLAIVAGGRGTLAGRPTAQGDVWLVPAGSDAFAIDLAGGVLLLAYTGEAATRSFARA
jgi:mannose-6-phosphate isomerase